MSVPAAPDAAPAEPSTDPAPDPAKPEDALGDAGKKALDAMKAERNQATKRAAEMEARLKEIEDRDKSETERQAEKVTATERRAAEAETRATRLEVILDKLPDGASVDDVRRLVTLSKRLVGTTREELEADAVELLTTFQTAPSTPGRPQGDIGQGARPPAQITDPRARDLAQIEADLKVGARRP